MADPTGTGGPSRDDVKNAEDLNKEYSEMRNTLRDISFGLLNKINEEIQDWDDVSKSIVQSIGRDLNREITDSLKLTKALSDSEKGIGKSLTTQVKVQEQIRVVEERKRSVMSLIEELRSEGITVTKQMEKLQNDLLKTLNKQDEALQRQLNKVKRFEELLGDLGGLMKGLSQIPIVGQFIKADEMLPAINSK